MVAVAHGHDGAGAVARCERQGQGAARGPSNGRAGVRWRERAAVALLVLAAVLTGIAFLRAPTSSRRIVIVRVAPGETLSGLAAALDPGGNVEEHAWQLAEGLGSDTLIAGETLRIVEGPHGAPWTVRILRPTEA
jgi:hypothetical protein